MIHRSISLQDHDRPLLGPAAVAQTVGLSPTSVCYSGSLSAAGVTILYITVGSPIVSSIVCASHSVTPVHRVSLPVRVCVRVCAVQSGPMCTGLAKAECHDGPVCGLSAVVCCKVVHRAAAGPAVPLPLRLQLWHSSPACCAHHYCRFPCGGREKF